MEKNRLYDPEENAETKEYSNIEMHLTPPILGTYIEAACFFPAKLGLIAKRAGKKEQIVNEFLRLFAKSRKEGCGYTAAFVLGRDRKRERERKRKIGGRRKRERGAKWVTRKGGYRGEKVRVGVSKRVAKCNLKKERTSSPSTLELTLIRTPSSHPQATTTRRGRRRKVQSGLQFNPHTTNRPSSRTLPSASFFHSFSPPPFAASVLFDFDQLGVVRIRFETCLTPNHYNTGHQSVNNMLFLPLLRRLFLFSSTV